MTKKSSPFLHRQKIAAGVVVAVFVGIFGYLYTLVLTEAPLGEFVEGEHYTVLADPRRVRGEKVEVMEFFSYACVHCYNFDPGLRDWVEANQDSVEFVRTPAVGSNAWRLLGRTYYTMAALGVLEENHARLFYDVHEVRRAMDTPDKIAAWIDGKSTTATAFLSMLTSPQVDRQVDLADQMATRLNIASVPSIIVNGKYLVTVTSDVGPSRMLDVMDYLVKKELADKQAEELAVATP